MLDYTKREKKVLPVKLIDGRTVLLTAPKKALYTKLISLESNMKEVKDFEIIYNDILLMTAEILSQNKSGVKFTSEEVDSLMDIEDMALLIFEYEKYASTLVSNPN